MNFALTPEQRKVRDAARRFTEEEILPHATAWDRQGRMPRDVIHRLGEAGFLGGPLPREVGGREWDTVSLACAYEELGVGDQSVRGFVSVQLGLVSQCLQDHGTRTQREAWLPRLTSGEAVGCYCLTEPEAGSDVASLRTRAEPDDEGWALHGEKIWITNGGIADLCLVFARIPDTEGDADPEETPPRSRSLTAFLVPADSEGLERIPMEGRLLGHRASNHCRLRFDGVRVGPEAVLGQVDGGFEVAMSALDHGRLGVAAGGVGTARACLEAVLDHARERRQFGRRIGDFQMVQERLADLDASVEAARLLVRQAAWLRDQGEPVTRAVSRAKLYATEVAQETAETALLLLASRGYTDASVVERHYRDIPGLRIYEGTNIIQRIVVARDMLGPDPEREPRK